MYALENFLKDITYDSITTPEKIDARKSPYIRDVQDLPILVSAIMADVDILITGDKDFNDIKMNKPIIFTPAQYYEQFAI